MMYSKEIVLKAYPNLPWQYMKNDFHCEMFLSRSEYYYHRYIVVFRDQIIYFQKNKTDNIEIKDINRIYKLETGLKNFI